MKDTVIRVENIGKRYRIGLKEKVPKSLGGRAKDLLASPFKYLNSVMREPSPDEVFWALKDVSFEVKRGEVLGIIGRNGAGKSTLLKILSRITEPTQGFAEIHGRVGSLLEVGTGFHPDLTGRENAYLNGTIMGMKKREIDQRFDEIVDFAEVEKFIDTPVKHYSSGMYTRLAFAVAAHLTPEILIVDEVLAVGDVSFQEKCLHKMESVSSDGRTVIFVSHNMDSVRKLSTKGAFMTNGTVVGYGEIEDVVQQYMTQFHTKEEGYVIDFDKATSTGYYIDRIEVLDLEANPKDLLLTWDSVRFRIFFYAPQDLRSGSIEFYISTTTNSILAACSSRFDSDISTEFYEGMNYIDCVFPKLMLSAGKYVVGAGITIPNSEWLYKQMDASVIEVGSKDIYNSGLAPHSSRCLIANDYKWQPNSGRNI
jgi:lipopolysaccharide transport system ATP-binding protein